MDYLKLKQAILDSHNISSTLKEKFKTNEYHIVLSSEMDQDAIIEDYNFRLEHLKSINEKIDGFDELIKSLENRKAEQFLMIHLENNKMKGEAITVFMDNKNEYVFGVII